MGRWGWRIRSGGVAAATVLAFLAPAAAVGTRAADRAVGSGEVVLRRTAHGIPHVLARGYGGLGYGVGYAYAQDNLCALADDVLTVSGQRSRWFGPDALTADQVDNLDSDVYYTDINRAGVIEALLSRRQPLGPSPRARELMRGYAAGVDAYLARQGVANLPDPTCRGAGWVRPISELDLWRRAYQVTEAQGGAALRAEIATAAPPGATAPARRCCPAGRLPLSGSGSNAFAIGRQATTGGGGMLLANPHLPWSVDQRLYQLQLTFPGQLNVAGATVGGLPIVAIGHTEGLAWTHTTSTAAPDTLTQLSLVPGDPTSYLVSGQVRRMTARTVTVRVRRPDGDVTTVSRTLYRTPDGPVVQIPGLLDWSAETAYVLRDANADNLRAIDQWLAIDRGRSISDLRAAQAHVQGLPWTNTLAVDATGTAFYDDVQVVPDVSDALQARCATATSAAVSAVVGLPVLDGGRADCRWGRDPTAVEPGLIGPARLPALVRADYVTNSNDSPWLTNPAAPLTGFPRVVGAVGTARSLRTRLGLDMVARRRAGTDGFGPPGFTLDSLQDTMLADRDYSAELALDAVVRMCTRHPTLSASDGRPVDVRAACRALAGWDGRGRATSRGAVLWREFFLRALNAAGDGIWRTPFDPGHPLATPRDLDVDMPAVRATLADAAELFTAAHLAPDLPLGGAQRYLSIPIQGCTQAEGCFNAIEPGGDLGPDGTYPDVAFGTGFLMAVELGPDGPHGRTLLVYSESANPRSPLHTDQTRLYAAGRWVTERFTEADIATDPALTVQVLHPPG